jgi:hypothetical protein
MDGTNAITYNIAFHRISLFEGSLKVNEVPNPAKLYEKTLFCFVLLYFFEPVAQAGL